VLRLKLKRNNPVTETWEIRYCHCSYAFPQDDAGFARAFPLVATLAEGTELYNPEPGEYDAKRMQIWRNYRKKTYKPGEYLGILLAMAQKQRETYDSWAFRHVNILDKLKKEEFEVSGYAGCLHSF
jgi:hypothetical protein